MHACLLCWGALLLKKCWRKYFLHQIFISCLFSFISFHLFQGHSITAITCSVYPSSMTLRKHIYLLSLISFFVEFTLERNIFFNFFQYIYLYNILWLTTLYFKTDIFPLTNQNFDVNWKSRLVGSLAKEGKSNSSS